MRRTLVLLVLLGGCRTHLAPSPAAPEPYKRVVVPIDARGYWDMCVELSDGGLLRVVCRETVNELRERYRHEAWRAE
jgi:hypothetical protein